MKSIALTAPTGSTKSRIENLDFARAIAILMVILVHVTENIYSFKLEGMETISTSSKCFAFFCFTLGRIGVPIFLFLTGYLMMDRTYESTQDVFHFWKKKLIPMIITFECWTVIYEIFSVFVLKQEFGILCFLQRIFFMRSSFFSHMWYMPMIIGIYFMMPFVSYVLNHFSVKLLIIPAGICLIYYFICPNLELIAEAFDLPDFSNKLSLEFTGGCYGLYVICGYFVKRLHAQLIQYKKKHAWFVPLLLLLSMISFIFTIVFQLWLYSKDYKYNVYYGFAPLLFCTLFLFIVITLTENIPHLGGVWKSLSLSSLGIFFIHNLVLKTIRYYNIFSLMTAEIINPLKVVIFYLLVFLLSYLLVRILSLIPKVSKILFLK